MYRLLVIVDAQNDFVTGSLGSKTADAAVPNIVSLIQNHEWDNIVCTMDTHGDDYFETLEGKKLPVKHCDNHKVDIDCCSYMSGKTVLLNLDTFDEHIFTVDKEDE